MNDQSPQHESAFKGFKEAHKADVNMSWLPRQVLTDYLHHLMLLRYAFFGAQLTFYILYLLQTASHVHIFMSQDICWKSPLNFTIWSKFASTRQRDREKCTLFKIWIFDLAKKKKNLIKIMCEHWFLVFNI